MSSSNPTLPYNTVWDGAQELQRQAVGLCGPAAQRRCGSDCCHALERAGGRVVAVALPDMIALAGYLERPADPVALRRAVERLVDRYCTLSPFTSTYMLTSTGTEGRSGACPFLGPDGRCQVYTARPLLCRVFFHCDWTERTLTWDDGLDNRVVGHVLNLAVSMGNLWSGHSGILWRQEWRYDAMLLDDHSR